MAHTGRDFCSRPQQMAWSLPGEEGWWGRSQVLQASESARKNGWGCWRSTDQSSSCVVGGDAETCQGPGVSAGPGGGTSSSRWAGPETGGLGILSSRNPQAWDTEGCGGWEGCERRLILGKYHCGSPLVTGKMSPLGGAQDGRPKPTASRREKSVLPFESPWWVCTS